MPSGDNLSEKPSRYQPLIDFLTVASGEKIVLTFTEIAAMIGSRSLPESAILRTEWWAYGGNSPVQLWRAVGWQAHSDRNNLCVHFTRDAGEVSDE